MDDFTQEQLIYRLNSIEDTLTELDSRTVEVLQNIDLSVEKLTSTIDSCTDNLYDRALNTDYILCRIAGALIASLPPKDYATAEAFAQELYKKAFRAREPK